MGSRRCQPVRPCKFLLIAVMAISARAGAQIAWQPALARETAQLARPAQAIVLIEDVASGKVLAAVRLAAARRLRLLPGSAIKPWTALALLRSGVVRRGDHLRCLRVTPRYGQRFACVHPAIARPINLAEALGISCNYFFLTVAQRLPFSAWQAALAPYGLRPDRVLSGAGGLGPAAIGAAGIHVTPWQLARAYLRLLRQIERHPRDRALQFVASGLRGCVQYGSCQAAAVRGWPVAGKTGTISEQAGESSHAWFAGFAPLPRPRVLVLVLVPKGSGSRDAAGLGGRILRWLHAHPGAWAWRARPPAGAATVRVRLPRGPAAGRFRIVRMRLEDYVAGVVQGEAGQLPLAAQKAMAVLARTWALTHRGRHAAAGYDFCTLTHCQAWLPPGSEAQAAARATAGEILVYHGRPVQVLYSANCGGYTESAKPPLVPHQVPYLRAHPDPFCRNSPNHTWTAEIRSRDLARALAGAGVFHRPPARFDLAILSRDRAGRAQALLLTRLDSRRRIVIRADDFRFDVDRRLGWNRLKSTWFSIRRKGRNWVFIGHGLGHGAGLCEAGAAGMARRGATWAAILAFYYPHTRIERWAPAIQARPPLPAATAPPGGGGFHWQSADTGRCQIRYQAPAPRRVLRLCEPLLAAAERELGYSLPGKLTLTVFPSTAAFIAATGQSGWYSGLTRGRKVALQPEALLVKRGILRHVLEHELLHVVLQAYLRPGISHCTQEGLAMLLAGEPMRARGLVKHRTAAQRETALENARTPAALRAAYAACGEWVAAQVSREGLAVFLHSHAREKRAVR